jgi:hypothetical protein
MISNSGGDYAVGKIADFRGIREYADSFSHRKAKDFGRPKSCGRAA